MISRNIYWHDSGFSMQLSTKEMGECMKLSSELNKSEKKVLNLRVAHFEHCWIRYGKTMVSEFRVSFFRFRFS